VVVGVLGEGGMGRVLVARQRSLERDVAVKRPRASASARDAELLRAEAVVTGHLEHPNIIPVHALGVDDGGRPLIVMKRVEGVSWRDLLRDADHPGWARREPNREAREVWHLGILAQLCNAIAFAHSRGIVHRDMKPDNVMIGEFGEVYLIDWGVAVETGSRALTSAGSPLLVGTPAYMAPEMAEGGSIDERTDIYLLGATLHEVLTGRVRHDGADLHAVTLQALASLPIEYGESVADELAQLANRATARDPAARPPDPLALRQALLDHLAHRGSLRLSAEADRTMAAIEANPADAQSRAIEECRFGYREALREWPDNPDGLRGMRRCAIAAVRLELARRSAAAARAALAEVADPPAELAAEVAGLEAALAAEQEEQARLRQLAEDADSRVGGAARQLLVRNHLILAAAVTLYAVHLQARGQVGSSELIALPVVIAAGSLLGVLLARRRVLVNAFSRRLVAWFQVLVLMLVASRVVGQAIGLSPAQQFTIDGVLMTAILAAGAIYNFRWIWLCAAMTGGATVVCVLVPDVALVAFGATASVLPVVAAFLMRRQR
jgi:serine/threonine-protein kinase